MSETFDAAWLELRESVDHRSRAVPILDPLLGWWTARGASSVLDLGSGTGSNLRYLAPKLPGQQRWTVLDHDAGLLRRARSTSPAVTVHPVVRDLAGVGLTEVKGTDLVTASALLDLVSEAWLDGLVDACVASRCGALFALTYDGTIGWSRDAEDPFDLRIRDAVNEHQRRDKGLGPARGPDAAPVAEEFFRARGYSTWLRPSPWSLGPSDAALSRALIAGWVVAAVEMLPAEAAELRAWGARRAASAESPTFTLTVGHWDLLALPPTAASSRS
ncbi:MAG: class I SAM-dependent methyltransferase [Gemmatimonadetes bacterium]|nr:class I SAM-dependent methyltransferase [Gemmatimonadota bacterium]